MSLGGADAVEAGPRWWHAWGRVMGEDDYLPGCWSMVLIGPSGTPPEEVARFAAGRAVSWGEYLGSWDHAPSDAEQDEVTPVEFRDEQEEPA